MKKVFKVESICEGNTICYTFYKKRQMWGWKFVFKPDAMRVSTELAEPPTYVETKKNNYYFLKSDEINLEVQNKSIIFVM